MNEEGFSTPAPDADEAADLGIFDASDLDSDIYGVLNPDEKEEEEDDDPSIIDVSKRSPSPDLDSMSFDERIERLKFVITQSPLHREIFYKTLKYCQERHILSEVEEFIEACPEFPAAVQSPYYLLQFLLRGGGIDVLELDENGEIVLPEQKEGLTEDEIDDLVVELAFETNEFGDEIVEQMSPKKRLLELLEITPQYYDTFIEVLDFLTEKRSLAEVDHLLRGRDILALGREPGEPLVQPSVFVDKLERVGGIVWKDGWIITDEGKDVLETLKERRT